MRTYEVHGSKDGVACMKRGLFVRDAEEYAKTLDHAAIYREEHLRTGRKLSNLTDEEFLFKHYDSPYWTNRGVKSTPKR